MTTAPEDELSLDFETQSEVDLKQVGSYLYAKHPTTRVLCMAWAFNDEPAVIWKPWEPLPDRVFFHLACGGKVRGWNSFGFERLIINLNLAPRHGWPMTTTEQWVDTMYEAGAMGLPFGLGPCGEALRLDDQKDTLGHKVMLIVCKPSKLGRMWCDVRDPSYDRNKHVGGRERFDVLYRYCIRDVDVERGIKNKVRRLPEREDRIMRLTVAMNDRGVRIDRDLVSKTAKVVSLATTALNREMKELTGGTVKTANEVQKLRSWLELEGVQLGDSLDKDAIAELLTHELTPTQHRVLEVRAEAAKASTAKINAMQRSVDPEDDRLRGMTRYYGATSGRFSATGGIQLQNLPRPDPTLDVPAIIGDLIDFDFKEPNALEFFSACHGSALPAVASALRGMLIPEEGHEFIAADLGQIELRMNGRQAGQESVVQAFRAYDAKEGPDLYSVAAAEIYGITLAEVKKDVHRPTGKVGQLACGYAGGASALLKMAKNNRVDLAPLYRALVDAADPLAVEKADEAWAKFGCRHGAPRDAWMSAELIKLGWRAANPMIVAYWYELERAAIDAVRQPGTWTRCREIAFIKQGRSLRMRLPSGRYIFFPYARVISRETEWGTEKFELRAMAQNLAKQWTEYHVTGGILCNNAVQGASRDLITDAMLELDPMGYHIVLGVHDELIAEVPKGWGSVEEFSAIMAREPVWLPGLPVVAEGWRGDRYRK